MTEPVTLGPLLVEQARALLGRRLPRLDWLERLQPALRRARELPTPDQERFRRIEVAVPPGPDEPAGEPAAVPRWPAAETVLPSQTRARLREVVGPRADEVRVRSGPGADELARRHHADAVTVEQDVYVRTDRLDPHGPAGFGLLVHEATHAVQGMLPDAAWRRATDAGAVAEERLARQRETAVRLPGPPPMAADTDRDSPTAAAPPATTDRERLREDLYRDLLRQLRVDRERGA